jgi:hypothetical protein
MVLELLITIVDLLWLEVSSKEREEYEDLMGRKQTKEKKSAKLSVETKKNTRLDFDANLTNQICPHDPKDYFITGVNLHAYFQRVFNTIKNEEPEFLTYLRDNLSEKMRAKVNDVMSLVPIYDPSHLVPANTVTHDYKEKVKKGVELRRFAKVQKRR